MASRLPAHSLCSGALSAALWGPGFPGHTWFSLWALPCNVATLPCVKLLLVLALPVHSVPQCSFTHVKESKQSKLLKPMLNKPVFSQNCFIYSYLYSLTISCHKRSMTMVFGLLSVWTLLPGFATLSSVGEGPHLHTTHPLDCLHKPKCQAPVGCWGYAFSEDVFYLKFKHCLITFSLPLSCKHPPSCWAHVGSSGKAQQQSWVGAFGLPGRTGFWIRSPLRRVTQCLHSNTQRPVMEDIVSVCS